MTLLVKVSSWANSHPLSSRLIIAIATILSVMLHYYAGIYLFAYDIMLPYSFALGFMILGVGTAFFYPFRHNTKGPFAYNYKKQKVLDFTIFIIGGLLVMYLGNQRSLKVFSEAEVPVAMEQSYEASNSQLQVHPVSASVGEPKNKTEFTLSRKEMRKQLKAQVKAFKKLVKDEIREIRKNRKKGERGNGANILLTLLTVLVALALGTLVAALACSLSCNGNELAGTVILIAGWAGIIILTFFVIRKIFGREKGPKPEPKTKDSNYPY